MRKIPENSSATSAFGAELRALYEAAGGRGVLTLDRLSGLGSGSVPVSSLNTWLQGTTVPRKTDHVNYVLRLLIPELERRAARRSPGFKVMKPTTWEALLHAAQVVSKSKQGGSGAARVHGTSPGRLLGGASPALRDVLPREFEGRDQELDGLTEFVSASQVNNDYLWFQAGPWAGKTALLAWFTDRYQLLAGVDFAHYFISGRLGTDRRDDFVRTVGGQLARAAGSRRFPAVAPGRPTPLDPWYEAAARACAERGRRLVLIVDGLDEDADAGLDHPGIAGVLPKAPPHGMRVVVSGRPFPGVPAKLVADHPLRDPGIVWRLADSPTARIIRDAAVTELQALLDGPDIDQRLLGLLASARGALSWKDLGELLGPRPRDLKKRLRTAVGRSLAPTRADLLPLDVRTRAEAEADRQTYVLAHAELLKAVCDELGEPFLRACADDLHHWAQEYWDDGWPEDTPNYLLSGYTRLVQEGKDPDRLTALVLDPRRQLRLVHLSGVDVALGELELIARPDEKTSLLVRAGAAVSREMLLARVRALPGAVAPAVARLGDPRRARVLAGTAGRAVDRALNLAAVARGLRGVDDKQAACAALEAGGWARSALEEAGQDRWAADEAEAAAAQVALVLVEAGAQGPGGIGEPHAEGLALLRSTRGVGSALIDAWALAARLLAPDHPEQAAELLDELEEQAETLAGADPVEGSAAGGSLQIWEAVAGADPDREVRLHARALAHAAQVREDAPTLESVAVLAAAASFAVQSRPADAEEMVATACRHLERVLHADGGPLSEADAFHVEFGFRQTLDLLSQALTDVGTPPDSAARVLELGRRVLPEEPADLLSGSVPQSDEDEGQAFAEAGRLADEAFSLAADPASHDQAEQRLEQALALLPTAGSGRTGRAPAWLPELADALIRRGAAAEAESLLDLVDRPADLVRMHAAMALASADSEQLVEARRHAREASRVAARTATAGRSRPYAAQALAAAGEVDSAVELVALHRRPDSAGARAEWRKADRALRIAVAAELATLAPAVSGELILPLLQRLDAARSAIRSQGLLTSLVELLPAVAHLPPEQQVQCDEAMEHALAQAARRDPQSWRPEEVLVQAFLRVGAGEEPRRQLDWLTHDMASRGAEHFPTAALAVLHTAVGDIATARRVAALPVAPHRRATALTAVAAHLARIRVRPSPVHDPDPFGTDAFGSAAFTRAIQRLALTATSATPPAPEAAVAVLDDVLTTAGWHQALPILGRLVPEAVVAVKDISIAHLSAEQKTPVSRQVSQS